MGPPIFIGGNTIRRPRPTLFCSLQWGRRFSSAEIALLKGQALRFHHASMGPPIFIGGNKELEG